jgi:DNA-binding beta-propeller fold protein YncE
VGFAPIPFLFVGLALGEAIRWQRKLFLPIDWALCLVVPFIAVRTFGTYVGWAGSLDLAQSREPAVELDQFTAWQQAQEADAAAGRATFNVQEWKQRLATGQTTVSTTGQASPPAAVALAVLLSGALPSDQGLSAPHVGQTTAELGASGDGKLNQPHGVAVDPNGNVYVADAGNQRVVKLDPSGNLLLTFSPHAARGQESQVFDVAVEPNGNVDLLDSTRGVVDRFGPDGTYLATLLGELGLYHPRALAVAPNGNLFVADTGGNRIVEATPSGTLLASINRVSGVALDQPTSVAVAPDGSLFVAEPEATLLLHLTADGQVLGTRLLTKSDTVTAAHLATLPNGNVVVADPMERAVSVLTPDLKRLAYLGPSGPGGPSAVSVAVAPNGDIWVVDTDRSLVQHVATIGDLPSEPAVTPVP